MKKREKAVRADVLRSYCSAVRVQQGALSDAAETSSLSAQETAAEILISTSCFEPEHEEQEKILNILIKSYSKPSAAPPTVLYNI